MKYLQEVGMGPVSPRLTKKALIRLMTALQDNGYPSIDESFKYVSCAVMSFFHSVSMSCICCSDWH